MKTKPKRPSFRDFQVLLADILEVDPEQIKAEAYFVTDLGIDSLKLAANDPGFTMALSVVCIE